MLISRCKHHPYSVIAVVLASLLYFFSMYYGLELYEAKVELLESLEVFRADELFLPLLIIFFGIFFDVRRHRKNERLKAQKMQVLHGVMTNVDHLLRNLLNNLCYFRDELEEAQDVSQETVDLFDAAIKDATEELNKLGQVEKIPDTLESGVIKNKVG